MRLYFKLILFISAYTPLLVIIMLRYFQIQSYKLGAGILVIILYSNAVLFSYLFTNVKKRSNRQNKPQKVTNITSDTLNYILPYVVSFIGFQFTDWVSIISLLILLGVVFVIYVHSNLILMNPLLNAIGYKFFRVELINDENIIVISKKDIKKNITIKTKRIDDDLYFLDSDNNAKSN